MMWIILVFIAVIIAVILFFVEEKIAASVVGVVSVVFFFLSITTIVPPEHAGVQKLFGKLQAETLEEGFHFVHPFMRIIKMSAQTQSYTMSNVSDEGEKKGLDAIEALTKDNLTVALDVTALYMTPMVHAVSVYRYLGTSSMAVEKLIRPSIRTAIRNVVSRYNASEVMSEKRSAVEIAIMVELDRILNGYFSVKNLPQCIVCEKIMLRNVVPPQTLKDAIELKLKLEQESLAMDFTIAKERKEAERKIIEAQGIEAAQKVINKSLTQQYLQWYYIGTLKELVDSPNNSTLILPFDQKLTPLINLK